jgi:hypothetical protein
LIPLCPKVKLSIRQMDKGQPCIQSRASYPQTYEAVHQDISQSWASAEVQFWRTATAYPQSQFILAVRNFLEKFCSAAAYPPHLGNRLRKCETLLPLRKKVNSPYRGTELGSEGPDRAPSRWCPVKIKVGQKQYFRSALIFCRSGSKQKPQCVSGSRS